MSVRKLTLQEWFLRYQLKDIQKNHFNLPIWLSINVTRLTLLFTSKGQRVPYNSLIIKTIGLMAARHPEVNRMHYRGLFSLRVIEFQQISVNLPILYEFEEQKVLSATSVRDPHQVSWKEIQKKLPKRKT